MIDYTNEIRNVIINSSDLTAEQIANVSNDANITDLGIDSLALVEAIIEIENKFNISIELNGSWMEEVDITINGLNSLINEKLNG